MAINLSHSLVADSIVVGDDESLHTVIPLSTPMIKSSTQKQLFIGNGASLLSIENQHILNEFFGNKDQQWKILYKASRDGFSSSDFHHHCDQKDATMTVIQSIGDTHLFGGYTSIPWTTCTGYKYDPTAFLFTLKSSSPMYYTIEPQHIDQAVLHRNDCGPCFGRGDLYISSNCNQNRNSSINFGNTYNTIAESSGKKHFTVREIEVYNILID
ncbi:unnamed protein product [Adineta steineri]|uniref:TLDc domain-containing protein n=1 Tax=Adineta steineri TaxID=433720 RepID=A0A813N3X9_9BILA|nr:unnamed protein product [Adineta steineri]CAF0739601.1 unnamed protein product [Adineta steineri]CAF0749470.1 unnamed protein product [Adineta steineri]